MTIEDNSIIAAFAASGLEGQITDLNTPRVHDASSYHYRIGRFASSPSLRYCADFGKGKEGCAVDVAQVPRAVDSPKHMAVFDYFAAKYGPELTELIHGDAPFFIHLGRRYPIAILDPAIRQAHRDHVHIAVAPGTALQVTGTPTTTPTPPKPLEDPVAPYITVICPTGGYWEVKTDNGGVDAYDGAPFFGSLPGLKVQPASPIIGLTPFVVDSVVKGYWLYDAVGAVYAVGDAPFLGCCVAHPEWNSPGAYFVGLVQSGGFTGDEVKYKQLRREAFSSADQFEEYNFPLVP